MSIPPVGRVLYGAPPVARCDRRAAFAVGQPLNYDKIQIVTIKEIIEENKRLDIPMSLEVVKAALCHFV